MEFVFANGARIPVLGLGTWSLEGRACSTLVEKAVSEGYCHIDTAAMYRNEEAVGAGLRASGVDRDKVFVTTKVWWTDLEPDDFERSTEASLSRLGLDHVDLLLIHWPNPAVELEATITALNSVRERGLTRHIGVSNFTTALLARAIGFSAAPLVANQVEHHPYLGQKRVHAACQMAGMAMVSYCPLYRGGALFDEDVIRDAAEKYNKSAGQIVLRWHVQQEGVVAIPRTSKAERLRENIALFDFALDADEMRSITNLARRNDRLCDFAYAPEWDRP